MHLFLPYSLCFSRKILKHSNSNMWGANIPRRYFILLFYVLTLSKECFGNLKTIYVEDICRSPVTYYLDIGIFEGRETSGIIKSHRHGGNDAGFDCTIIILPKSAGSVVLSVYKVALWSDDILTITDSNGHIRSLHAFTSYQDERKSYFSRGHMKIHYKTGNSSDYQADTGFQFTYTQATDYPCFTDEYQCANQRCIWEGLACDGHNQCGDNSDERNCVPRTWLSPYLASNYSKIKNPGQLAGIILGSLSITLIVIAIAVYLVRRKRRLNKQVESSETTIVSPETQGAPLSKQNAPSSEQNAPSSMQNAPSSMQNAPSSMQNAPSLIQNTQSSMQNAPSSMQNTSLPPQDAPLPYPNYMVHSSVAYSNIYPEIQPPTAPDFEEAIAIEVETQ